MAEDHAYIRVSLTEGIFEVRGSEEFVTAQAERFEDLIHDLLRNRPDALGPRRPVAESDPHEEHRVVSETSGSVETYPRVFQRGSNGAAVITARVPGATKSDKTANVALLLGLARSLDGDTAVSKTDVIDACTAHACFDSPNFKRTLKDRKEHFLIEGSAHNYEVRLTVPGKEAATKLAVDLSAS